MRTCAQGCTKGRCVLQAGLWEVVGDWGRLWEVALQVPLCRPAREGDAEGAAPRYSPVEEGTLQALLTEAEREEYENNIVATFLDESACWQTCPTHCGHAIHCTVAELQRPAAAATSVAAFDVACACGAHFRWQRGACPGHAHDMSGTCPTGAHFCWQCKAKWPLLESHAPLPCEMIAGWHPP